MKTARLIACVIAAGLWACGGSLGTFGDDDGTADTTVDTGSDDTPTDGPDDTGSDVPMDTSTDAPIDVDPDASCILDDTRCSLDGTALENCNASGTWDPTPCPHGCASTPEPHCRSWHVSNLPDPALLTAGEPPVDLTLPDEGSFWLDINTDDGEIVLYDSSTWDELETIRPAGEGLDADSGIHFAVVSQGEGFPSLGVFSFHELTIPVNYTYGLWGANVLVLVSETDVTIDGGVWAGCSMWTGVPMGGAFGTASGPGAGTDGTTSATSTGTGYYDGGGGGAAYGGPGGNGGGVARSINGDGGSTYGASELVPIVGGSGGGWGASNSGTTGGRDGGYGGGAVQIVALGVMSITGYIDAAGCGGYGPDDNEGGGGGGAGGAILLEAPEVHVAGWLTVNGGGGGGGGEEAWGDNSGDDGYALTDNPAEGGGAGSYGCDGGDGNGGGGDFGATAEDPDECYNFGGGGAGSGRIRINGSVRNLTGGSSPATSSSAFTEADLIIS